MIYIASAVLLYIFDDCSTQWSGKEWIPSLKLFFPCGRFPFTFVVQKNQAVGQKGNVYIFAVISNHFTCWTKPPGNWNTVLCSWKVWSKELRRGRPSLQVLSHKCVLPVPHTCPQMQILSVPGSSAVLVLWSWHTENKAWERKGVGGSCRNSLSPLSKENFWKKDGWKEECAKEELCWFWLGFLLKFELKFLN